MPYTSPDVKPGNINPELPYDLFNLPMGNKGISKIPEIIDAAMQSPDGFKVIQELCNGNRNSDRDRMINVQSTQSSLKEVFGDQYDQLADLVKKEMREMGDGIKQKVEQELQSRDKRNANFDKVWGEIEPKILKSLSDAIGMDITTDPNQLEKLKEMMNLENLVRSYKGMNQSGEDQLELTLSWLNRQLITSAMSEFMKDSIASILKAHIPALKKIGVKNTFVKAWKQIRDDAAIRFAISPQQMDDALRVHVRSDNNKIEDIFDEELRQANLTKSFKR